METKNLKLKSVIPQRISFSSPLLALACADLAADLFGAKRETNIVSSQALTTCFLDHEVCALSFYKSPTSFSIAWNDSIKCACHVTSAQQFLDLIADDLFVKVGSYDVTFHKGAIKVGCTDVSNELVRKIASQLKD